MRFYFHVCVHLFPPQHYFAAKIPLQILYFMPSPRMRRGTIFSHKITTTQQATTNCHMLLLHAIHTHLVTPRSLLSRSLYSWNHKRQQQRQHKYPTDNEKQLFCQRLIENYWEFLFFHTNVAWRNFLSLFKYILSSWKGRIGWFFYGTIRWSVFFFFIP